MDVWSVGCIIAELYCLQPLFSGTSEGDQLNKIIRILGKPAYEEWPKSVPIQWHSLEPREPIDLKHLIPNLCENGSDLLTVRRVFKGDLLNSWFYFYLQSMLTFDPDKRLSALEALNHIYFQEEPLNM